MRQEPLDVRAALEGKNLLFIGATGFVGKVLLTMLMEHYGSTLGQVFCLVRKPRDGRSAAERFADEVVGSEPFEAVRKRVGAAAFDGFVQQRLVPMAGDVTLPQIGFSEADNERVMAACDLVINCSGLVDFNPPLDDAISINVTGVQRVVEFAHTTRGKSLINVSTCYVAGNHDGHIYEDGDLVDWFPKRSEHPEVHFDHVAELESCLVDIERIREDSMSSFLQARFEELARERLEALDEHPEDPAARSREVEKARRRWQDDRLVERGMERSLQWGWSNTYTFTKSLGEQVVASSGLDRWSIVRPSVVESSLQFPFPGWNEGINTSAPLVFLGLKGHSKYPTRDGVTLDVIPVDMVASALIASAAALFENRHQPVYQVGTSDINAIGLGRMVELTGLYKRDYYRRRPRGNPWFNQLASWFECYPVSEQEFRRTSAPAISRATQWASAKLTSEGAGRLTAPGGLSHAIGKGIMGMSKTAGKTGDIFDLFMPFIHDNVFIFHCDNTRALLTEHISEADRARLPWRPEDIDWRDYWLNVHCRGLEKWVFPRIKEKIKPKARAVTHYRNLLHLFSATVRVHGDRTALRYLRTDGRTERLTYGDLGAMAAAVAGRLAASGVGPGDRIVLCSANCPSWAAAYFGILKVGAVAVPVDREASVDELVNVCRAAGARAVLLSAVVRAKLNGTDLPSVLDIEAVADPHQAPPAPEISEPGADDLASLIYTSGTTGTPKGVMLSHGNFTFLLQALARVFEVGESDGMLSALPLHHTFEFSCGFLLPISRGAQIVYLEELDGDMLSRAFAGGNITVMVGVPALWELLHRKIRNQVKEKGPLARAAFKGLMGANKLLRDRFGVNAGKLLFNPVHQGFGGRIRFLVSGGASLPNEIGNAFRSLGLDLYEGYGLTEASPVLAVERPGKRPKKGSVGQALPGVELDLRDPDAAGVGEIVARGDNVMTGYLDDAEATAASIDSEGWLHTGDLGRIDEKGRLFIAGRSKELIVESSGKNVYPDELEELYGESAAIEELSVVGLPDGRGGERVAALVVVAKTLDREQGRADVEEHIRTVSAGLPAWKRPKVLRFYDGELPRTATRKVKRKEVQALLQRLLDAEQAARTTPAEPQEDGHWLKAALAAIVDKEPSGIREDHKLVDDLGFESLALTELLSTLETSTGRRIDAEALAGCVTVSDVLELVGSAPPRTVRSAAFTQPRDEAEDVILPEALREAGRSVMGRAQRFLYGDVLHVDVNGKGNVPLNRSLLVVSNHCSHLDMGLVKTAMGDAGKNLASMAASDYFFRPGPRQVYFENFTNLVPMARSGNLKDSLNRAVELLREGKSVLIFPEGTRSRDGRMAPFKRGVGYMALSAGVDILPVYLKGTHHALPVGSAMPRGRKVGANLGAVIAMKSLVEMTASMSRHQAYDVATAVIEDAVMALRDGRQPDPRAAMAGVVGESDPEAVEPAEAPMEGGATLGPLFSHLKAHFRPEKVEQPMAFYFSLGSESSSKWTLLVEKDSCEFKPGKAVSNADCVLKTDEETFSRIVKEHYVPTFGEFMSGKVKTNSPELLRTFQKVFGL